MSSSVPVGCTTLMAVRPDCRTAIVIVMREVGVLPRMHTPHAVPVRDVAVVPFDDVVAHEHNRVCHIRARLMTLGVDTEGDLSDPGFPT